MEGRRPMKTGSKNRSIRVKEKYPRLLDQIAKHMSREQALRHILDLLEAYPCAPTAIELMELFNIQGEELAEAGVSYEMLKALEKHSLVLKNLC